MELIIGGAYQGKRDYAIAKYDLSPQDIVTCTVDAPPERTQRCIDHLESYVLYCIQQGIEPDASFPADAVLIGRDIFSGVVPMDPELRLWREETGRFYAQLTRQADHVTRLFCGLPQVLK